jgi:hypothetical protein
MPTFESYSIGDEGFAVAREMLPRHRTCDQRPFFPYGLFGHIRAKRGINLAPPSVRESTWTSFVPRRAAERGRIGVR